MSKWKRITVALLGLSSFVTNAALIVDNDSNIANSFKDIDTNLVWMDFGVNNNLSFEYVENNLDTGGVYEGWRLPTKDEVYTMWLNAADISNAGLDYVEVSSSYIYSDAVGGSSVLQATFDAMGFNIKNIDDIEEPSVYSTESKGLYKGTNGLSSVFSIDYSTDADFEYFELDDQQDLTASYYSSEGTSLSTLLVRDSNQGVPAIPEPNVLFLFMAAALGLMIKRKA